MADVQLENGYSRIANEILNNLSKIKLNGTQFRIVLSILRYTYGFNRKEHDFSLTFLSEATLVNKDQIQRELNALIFKKILTVVKEASFNSSRTISFNKDYEQWGLISKEGANSPTGDEKVYIQVANSPTLQGAKKTPKKDNIKNNIKNNIYTPEFEEFYSIYPNAINKELTYKNYLKTIKKDSVDTILQATNNYISFVNANGTDKQYIFKSTNFVGTHMEYKNYINYENATVEKPYWANVDG